MSDERSFEDELRLTLMAARGIAEPDHICPACDGWGTQTYGNTATWRGGAGGMTLTVGVCDKCWGSGNRLRPWPSHRLLERAR